MSRKMVIELEITKQELAHILASLRYVQNAGPEVIADFPQFSDVGKEPLSVEQIDRLAERIDCSAAH